MPIRSLTEADGFMLSSFTTIRATQPDSCGMWFSCTRGVRPINAVMSWAIRMAVSIYCVELLQIMNRRGGFNRRARWTTDNLVKPARTRGARCSTLCPADVWQLAAHTNPGAYTFARLS